MNNTGVKIDIIPLISLAELKNPNVPALVISYVLYPIWNKVGTKIKIKYKNKVVTRDSLLIWILSFIEYKEIYTIGK